MARKPKTPAPGAASRQRSVAGGFGEEPQAGLTPAAALDATSPPTDAPEPQRQRRLLKLGPGGRVLIPADWRQAMELKDNDTLVATLVDGTLSLHGTAVGVRKARAIVRRFVPAGVSLADELIADRRREAARESSSEDYGTGPESTGSKGPAS